MKYVADYPYDLQAVQRVSYTVLMIYLDMFTGLTQSLSIMKVQIKEH